jgi:hypothetical protein
MLPPAPARLSTTKGWPSRWPISSETMRAVVSTPPPGGHGTISLMGCDGYLGRVFGRGRQRALPSTHAAAMAGQQAGMRAGMQFLHRHDMSPVFVMSAML